MRDTRKLDQLSGSVVGTEPRRGGCGLLIRWSPVRTGVGPLSVQESTESAETLSVAALPDAGGAPKTQIPTCANGYDSRGLTSGNRRLRLVDTIQTAWPSREPGMLLSESLGLAQWIGVCLLVILAGCAYAWLLVQP